MKSIATISTKAFIEKMSLTISFLLLVLGATAQSLEGNSWAAVKKNSKGELSVIYYEQPGLIYQEGGSMRGVCADILNDFAAFIKVKYGADVSIRYQRKEQNFQNFMRITQNTPNLLGVTNVTITEERKKIFQFTPSFLSNHVIILTNKDAASVQQESEIATRFKDFKAVVIEGSTHQKYADEIRRKYLPGLVISKVKNGDEALQAVSTDKTTFTILEFSEFIDATRKKLPVKRQGINFGNEEELAFIMSKQSDWAEPWQEFLTPAYKSSVQYRKIIASNLGTTFLALLKQ